VTPAAQVGADALARAVVDDRASLPQGLDEVAARDLGLRTAKYAYATSLDEVRAAVRNDWLTAQRSAANEAFYRRLRDRYEVTVDPLEGDRPAPTAAQAAP